MKKISITDDNYHNSSYNKYINKNYGMGERR